MINKKLQEELDAYKDELPIYIMDFNESEEDRKLYPVLKSGAVKVQIEGKEQQAIVIAFTSDLDHYENKDK